MENIGYRRGRIILTYFYKFSLMALLLFIVGLVLSSFFSQETLLHELQFQRILPLIIAALSALLPLGLLLGFWMGTLAPKALDSRFIKRGVARGFVAGFAWALILFGLQLLFGRPIPLTYILFSPIAGFVAAGLSFVVARSIVHAGSWEERYGHRGGRL